MRATNFALFAVLFVCSCGGPGSVKVVAVGGPSDSAGAEQYQMRFSISAVEISKSGADWIELFRGNKEINSSTGSTIEVASPEVLSGNYNEVKISLSENVHLVLNDGTIVDRAKPDILLYRLGAVATYSSSDHGFPDTKDYFLFTVSNTALDSTIEITSNSQHTIELHTYPLYPLDGPNLGFVTWLSHIVDE